VTAGLLGVSVLGCIWLMVAPRDGVQVMMAASLALAPLMTLLLVALGVAA
jgi:hypothetical protein